jgi:hypothetical protein
MSLPGSPCAHPVIPPTPESDITASQSPPVVSDAAPPPDAVQPGLPQKRKAGRKPLYKTAQERRDRNRRAQLAFRARRSDYLIKLEETCRSLENVVIELQESNRMANDALARERTRVKFLERMLQSQQHGQSQQQMLSPQQPTPAMFPVQTHDICMPDATAATQTVRSQLFQAHSLITLEQQFANTQPTNLNMFFAENYQGMLPLPINDLRVLVVSCRSITGLSPPSK